MDRHHADLLLSLGIPVAEEEIRCATPTPSSPILPYRPHHYDAQGMAIFTSEQIHWADPGIFGFHDDYLVVEEEETTHPLALNYADEVNLPRRRPVHKYHRHERFRFILGQLMGCSGHVPKQVLKAMDADALARLPADQVWDAVRSILKTHNWRIYYNRIPAILAGLGLSRFKFSETSKFQDILHDFDLMDKIFDSIKSQLGRTYFPNLRFIAVKLMRRHGLQPIIPIPLARTLRKMQGLEQVYTTIWQAIEEKQMNEFIASLQ